MSDACPGMMYSSQSAPKRSFCASFRKDVRVYPSSMWESDGILRLNSSLKETVAQKALMQMAHDVDKEFIFFLGMPWNGRSIQVSDTLHVRSWRWWPFSGFAASSAR
ncbi:hypothetical protein KP509_07G065400 [Ceratopteris richardii]|uniref:Uncharacterized protein n=1 Tax=Ceratopteris richardii TaxID=49495 RepID=A0A8T2UJ48_CERRI|nr:hypothetical protein KP509_07G065400 [Ceratopteris richardii]